MSGSVNRRRTSPVLTCHSPCQTQCQKCTSTGEPSNRKTLLARFGSAGVSLEGLLDTLMLVAKSSKRLCEKVYELF